MEKEKMEKEIGERIDKLKIKIFVQEYISLIRIFPALFFLLGLFVNSFTSIFENKLTGFLVFLIGLDIYFLLLLWFYHELNKLEIGLNDMYERRLK